MKKELRIYSGIEYCISLEILNLEINTISDISMLNNLTGLKGIECLTLLTNLDCSINNFPLELEAFDNDISKWQEYHRNN